MSIRKDINKNFFKEWTPEMAYVLGFLFADGSLDIRTSGSAYFSIHICDKGLLQRIRNVLGSTHTIGIRTWEGNARPTYRLQIGDRDMCKDLQKLGMSKRKAYIMTMPQVPDAYLHHFVRGYFDGDGNVWLGIVHKERKTSTLILHTVFSSCSKAFLERLKASLEKLGLSGGSLIYSRSAYRLQYSVKDSIMLCRVMYSDVCAGLQLQRKRRVFEKYLRMRS